MIFEPYKLRLGTLDHAKRTIERCRRLLAIKEQYARQVSDVGGAVRLIRIVEDMFDSPFVRIATLAKKLDVTYPTAKADIDRLVQAGVLHELPGVSPKTFYAPQVFNVAYGELSGDGDLT